MKASLWLYKSHLLIVLTTMLGLSYIIAITALNKTSYELATKTEQRDRVADDVQSLTVQTAQLGALQTVRAKSGEMVPIGTPTYAK